MMLTTLDTFLSHKLYPAMYNSLDQIFPEFRFERKSSGKQRWESTNREYTKQKFSARPDRVIAYENSKFGFKIHGGPYIPWLAYVHNSQGLIYPKGRDYFKVIGDLCEKAGVSKPDQIKNKPEDFNEEEISSFIEEIKQKDLKRAILEEFFAYSQKALYEEEKGARACSYLKQERKIDAEEYHDKLDVGFFPGITEVEEALMKSCCFSKAAITASEITTDQRWEGRLVIPLRDEEGNITSFAARKIDESANGSKYLNLKGGDKPDFIGLDEVAGSQEEVIIVEGILDRLFLPICGVNGKIVSLGGTGELLTADRWKFLSEFLARQGKPRIITLAMDNDEAGGKGVEAALHNLQKIHTSLKVSVLAPAELGKAKDPDEFVRDNGGEAFNNLIKKAIPGSIYQATSALREIQPISSFLQREEAAEKVLTFLVHEENPLHRDEILRQTAECTGYSLDALKDQFENHKQQKHNEEHKKAIERILNTENNINQRHKLIRRLEDKYSVEIETEEEQIDESFSQYSFIQEIKTIPIGLPAHWNSPVPDAPGNVYFNSGELIVIGARTGHGKTSFLVSLMAYWLDDKEGKLSPHEVNSKRFVMYSLEEARIRIFSRILSIDTKKNSDHPLAVNEILPHVRDTKGDLPKLNDAMAKLESFGERLKVISKPSWTAERITKHAKELAQRQAIGAIFIDYLQRIPYSRKEDRRDIELSLTGRVLKKLAIELNTPVIVGAQINREAIPKDYARELQKAKDQNDRENIIKSARPELHHLREGGIEQEADLILGLLNYTADMQHETTYYDGRSNFKEASKMEVGILKNRYGIPGLWSELTFEGRYGYIY